MGSCVYEEIRVVACRGAGSGYGADAAWWEVSGVKYECIRQVCFLAMYLDVNTDVDGCCVIVYTICGGGFLRT
jgi:hypothetical protein